ncbi:glycosyltransferase family 29 protein [Limimaricola pyoseonensis]|uniref:Glycosyltransferase family 29 (Sialyltransferase) n=1 Tax=Limimaricola pyoseonensis TaxID=521013 RepID=A0A1G6ZDA8_9RHOB|nr:glycosyltransferase family 29 protein [Limimaricola pyoseonensis]SDE00283.1 Glycosyltransferase family 29 (sialyltransferase) [Limimaricola pyoseonensis]
MNRLRFEIAKFRQDEAQLSTLGLPRAALLERLESRRVALVGNARALAATDFGREIDMADLVIRLNSAPMPAARSHGSRTDWLAMSTPVPEATLRDRRPDLLLWMTAKRKRLPWRIARREGFHLNPADENARLRRRLDAPATTGLMVIDLLARSGVSRAALYGFDFFASKSLSGRRDATQVPHDFDAERLFVEMLLSTDPRFVHRKG